MPKKLILQTNYNFDIEYSKQAQKFLDRHKELKGRFDDVILELPKTARVEALSGYDNRYKARVGDYRIIFDLYEDILFIYIVMIGSRGQVYKHLKKD